MDIHSISERWRVLDQIQAIALRLEPNELLALAGDYARRIVGAHPDLGVDVSDVIDEIVRLALAKDRISKDAARAGGTGA